MSTIKVNTITDANGGSNVVLQGVASPPNGMGFRNRIINGGMVIDQRNAGAAITNGVAFTFSVDRFSIIGSVASKFTAQQNAGAVTPPAGFSNYLGFTSSSAYSIGAGDYFLFRHNIEGFNSADLAWGTASAATVTLSFWVRSSLTGTFGGAIQNSAQNRSYPFTYTISAANTWEYKTETIAGDTSGTWIGATNGIGLQLNLSLGTGSTFSGTAGAWAASGLIFSATGAVSVVGTNGATFYITGVQLEVGSVDSPFERRDIGRELQLCQRYYHKTYPQTTAPADSAAEPAYGMGAATANDSGQVFSPSIPYPVCMRATPTFTFYRTPNSTTSGQGAVYNLSWVTGTATTPAASSDNRVSVGVAKTAAFTASYAYLFEYAYSATAEL